MLATLPLICCCLLQAIPPLTPDQRAQVRTASDWTSRFDEAALYPLMDNALRWQDGDEAGAMVPDRKALYQTPAQYRGQLFLIEGQFAGGARVINNLTRSGPWDEKLQQWVILTDRDRDEVAVVYLVDPPRPIDQPLPAGTRVRVVGRFYKVLRDTDRNGQPTDYLTFIAKSALVISDADQDGGLSSRGPLLVVGVLALLWFFMRRSVKVKPLSTRVRRVQDGSPNHAHGQDHPDADDGRPENLPDDPAAALSMLQDRHEEELRRSSQGDNP